MEHRACLVDNYPSQARFRFVDACRHSFSEIPVSKPIMTEKGCLDPLLMDSGMLALHGHSKMSAKVTILPTNGFKGQFNGLKQLCNPWIDLIQYYCPRHGIEGIQGIGTNTFPPALNRFLEFERNIHQKQEEWGIS